MKEFDKVMFVRELKKMIPEVGFLELQDQNANEKECYVDVQNICFVYQTYFIIIWDFESTNGKIDICNIPSEYQCELYNMTNYLKSFKFPSKDELTFLPFKKNVNKDAFINYFTVMLCLLMPYTKFLCRVNVVDYQVDVVDTPIEINNILSMIQNVYDLSKNGLPL